MTGREGSLRTKYMKDYGTKVVAGVTPARGGQRCMACPYTIQSRRPSGKEGM